MVLGERVSELVAATLREGMINACQTVPYAQVPTTTRIAIYCINVATKIEKFWIQTINPIPIHSQL